MQQVHRNPEDESHYPAQKPHVHVDFLLPLPLVAHKKDYEEDCDDTKQPVQYEDETVVMKGKTLTGRVKHVDYGGNSKEKGNTSNFAVH